MNSSSRQFLKHLECEEVETGRLRIGAEVFVASDRKCLVDARKVELAVKNGDVAPLTPAEATLWLGSVVAVAWLATAVRRPLVHVYERRRGGDRPESARIRRSGRSRMGAPTGLPQPSRAMGSSGVVRAVSGAGGGTAAVALVTDIGPATVRGIGGAAIRPESSRIRRGSGYRMGAPVGLSRPSGVAGSSGEVAMESGRVEERRQWRWQPKSGPRWSGTEVGCGRRKVQLGSWASACSVFAFAVVCTRVLQICSTWGCSFGLPQNRIKKYKLSSCWSIVFGFKCPKNGFVAATLL